MDPRMNEYDGCQSSYQGCEMDQGMNGSDGYHSSFQDGGFGYDEQQEHCVNNQEAYTNNQGSYHHHQWNNNFQDPISFSSQHQEPCSSSSQYRESSLLSEAYELLEHAIKERKLLWALNEKLEERVNELERQIEEDKRVLDGLDETMESPIDEAPKTLTMEKCELPKVKKSLQALLESDDMGEFHSKVEHLRFILDNKDMLGEVLQEYEEEQCSSFHMRALFKEAPSMEKKPIVPSSSKSKATLEAQCNVIHQGYIDKMQLEENDKFLEDFAKQLTSHNEEISKGECGNCLDVKAIGNAKKETIRSEDVIQVEQVVKTTNVVTHDPPSVVKQREKLQPMQHAKRKRRKKPKKTKGRGIEPKPPLLTFTPLRFIDGKLECKVSSKGRSKPFSRVKILFAPSLKGEDWGTINEAMVKTFGMKLGDRGPLYQSKFPIPPNG